MNGWMDKRVCLVTGASGGIGKEIAAGLAKMDAQVVLVCRDAVKGRAAQAEIRQRAASDNVELLIADLSSQESVRSAVGQFLDTHDRLDVLINCAAVIRARRGLTVDGWETTLAINHLAPFLLTSLLSDCLKATAPSRVVNLTSAAHASMLDFDNFNGERGYSPLRAYAATKLMNVLFTYELARRLEGTRVTANCVHPGAVRSALFRDFSGAFPLLLALTRPFMSSPRKGARGPIYLATSPSVEGLSGRYFQKLKEGKSTRGAYDPAVARRLWEYSAQMVGVPSEPEYVPYVQSAPFASA
jgi:NAD(P)-dependent dehydrogenase (short-subunit alcohol dehydrogenase family)